MDMKKVKKKKRFYHFTVLGSAMSLIFLVVFLAHFANDEIPIWKLPIFWCFLIAIIVIIILMYYSHKKWQYYDELEKHERKFF